MLWVFVLIYLNSLYNKYNINTKGVFIQFIIIVKKEDSDGGSRDYQLFCIYFLIIEEEESSFSLNLFIYLDYSIRIINIYFRREISEMCLSFFFFRVRSFCDERCLGRYNSMLWLCTHMRWELNLIRYNGREERGTELF